MIFSNSPFFRRYLFYLAFLGLWTPFCVQAFTDVNASQPLFESVQYFLEKGSLQDGAFFAGDKDIAAGDFWKMMLSEVGATKDYPVKDLPLYIEKEHPLAPFLSFAIEKGLLSPEKPFNPSDSIDQTTALKLILASKGIDAPRRVSPEFRKEASGFPPRSDTIRFVEAAAASGILEAKDYKPFAPYRKLDRRTAVRWLYNFKKNGEIKSSTVDPTRYKELNPNRKLFARPRYTERQIQEGQSSSAQKAESKTADRHLTIPDGKVLEQVYSDILAQYRFSEKLTDDKKREMINSAIAGMVSAIGDKYSSYIVPTKVKEFKEDLDGNFEGIGAYVDMVEGVFTIVAPITGSPAEHAGILPGDIVTQVNGEEVKGKDINSVTDLIKGKEGTEVKLSILRGLEKLEITVVRGKITVPSLKLEWNKSVPVIGIHQFNKDTGVQLKAMIEKEILPKNPQGLVIDLRNNPGGYLVAAVQVGEIFLKKDQEIFSVDYGSGKQVYKASGDGDLHDLVNIVVLENKGTASASEIVAAMLQDYAKAVVMGVTSVGKGTVQNINPYDNGGILKLTVAKWISPKGRWIHEKGIVPDIEVEPQTPEERKAKIDRTLDRAVQYVLEHR